jgi:sulfonate transport system substrate-binding protein
VKAEDYYVQEFKERSAPSRLDPISDAAIASQQAVADTFAKAGVIPAKIDVRPLWDKRLDQRSFNIRDSE